jgi:hypothetical protein
MLHLEVWVNVDWLGVSIIGGVSMVWQVGHVVWATLEGGATERFLSTF